MAGRPRTREARKAGITCGAKTRKGTPCQRKYLLKGGKCPNHGGLSLTKADKERITATTGRIFKKPGPATEEGWRRSREALSAWRARRTELREKLRLAALAGLALADRRFKDCLGVKAEGHGNLQSCGLPIGTLRGRACIGVPLAHFRHARNQLSQQLATLSSRVPVDHRSRSPGRRPAHWPHLRCAAKKTTEVFRRQLSHSPV